MFGRLVIVRRFCGGFCDDLSGFRLVLIVGFNFLVGFNLRVERLGVWHFCLPEYLVVLFREILFEPEETVEFFRIDMDVCY